MRMMREFGANHEMRGFIFAVIIFLSLAANSAAQKKHKASTAQPKPQPQQTQDELGKLRDQYVKTTKEYKASLERLQSLYEADVKRTEQKREQVRKLFADGLMSQREVEDTEIAVNKAHAKVTEVQQQIKTADTQIAQALIEVEGDKQIAKLGPTRRGSFISTTSFIRYTGVGAWALAQAPKIETFFQQSFRRPLPIAVFGQGAIHNQWRLDHRNAMDISLNPDGAEGQALIRFLQSNGIPFSAFRGAIPGVATGPHIHIGMPSHRY
jgi:hypothetical protein